MGDIATPWLESYPPGVPQHVEVPEGNLAELLDEAAKRYPDAPALHFEGRTTTWSQVADQAWRFGAALTAMGVGKGTRVGLVLPNCPQAVVAFFGVLRIGGVVVQNNPLYTERELEHQLADSGAEVVVCLDLVYERIKALRARTPLRDLIVTSVLDELPGVKRVLAPYTKRGKEASAPVAPGEPVRRWRELMKATGHQAPAVAAQPDDIALLQYTGGTTGTAKGVMLTHGNLRSNTEQCFAWLPDEEVHMGREVILSVLPFFHVYGLTICLLQGTRTAAALVLLPRFDLQAVMSAVDRYRPTLLPGVPTMYTAINNAAASGGHDLSSIRACLSGAAPLPLEVAEEFERRSGGRLVEGYGLTEASPVTHANPIYGKRKVGSIGLPVPNTIARIVDPDNPEGSLPVGEPGELAVKGPQVMKGYWNKPEDTAAVLRDGWLFTGDIATMDAEGYFAIVDRKKDLIIAGGYNIYPREVEEVLYEHPKILEACVAGVPDAYRGETVKAFVVLRQGETATADEIRDFARERLAAYKVPRVVEFRDELPKTMIGKVLRRALVEEEQARVAAEGGAA